MAQPNRLNHPIKHDFSDFIQYLRGIYIRTFYLLLHIFFLIGEEFKCFSIALDVSLLFKQDQCRFDFFSQFIYILIKRFGHQNSDIVQSGIEVFDVFDQEKSFQDTYRKGIIQMFISDLNLLLHLSPDHFLDTFIHPVKTRQHANGFSLQSNHHVLKYPQHRSFTDSGILPSECIMGGEVG